jgi:Predicted membrane protein (DUF2079)
MTAHRSETTAPRQEVAPEERHPVRGWLSVALLTAVVTAISTYQSLRRYEEFRSGWSWDLAYYNQWFRAVMHGEGVVTVRPISFYAVEGPSVWKTNYLAPIRLVLLPFYALNPEPRTLLIIQNVVFWWIIPAAFGLVYSESRSETVAVSAAALVPLTPYLWPLVLNDFRELQLAGPFVVWAVEGVRSRKPALAAFAVAGMLACRQEFAVMVATFAFLPPRVAESLSRTLLWRRALILVGLVWWFFGFFGYLSLVVGPNAPDQFIDQFMGPRAPLSGLVETSAEVLILGIGAWSICALYAPRVAMLTLPWIWGVCNGRWGARMLRTAEWHMVRYVAPLVFLVVAAGLVGYGRLGGHVARRRSFVWGSVLWLASIALNVAGLADVSSRMAHEPVPIDRTEAATIWSWIRQVGPADAVLADYQVSAPLSSRRKLYGYEMDINLPPGFPRLDPEFRWVFMRSGDEHLNSLLDQGFQVVYRGNFLTIARRSLVRSP